MKEIKFPVNKKKLSELWAEDTSSIASDCFDLIEANIEIPANKRSEFENKFFQDLKDLIDDFCGNPDYESYN